MMRGARLSCAVTRRLVGSVAAGGGTLVLSVTPPDSSKESVVHSSRKYEHLYQRQIANAAELADEVGAFLATFNDVRPHETLGTSAAAFAP